MPVLPVRRLLLIFPPLALLLAGPEAASGEGSHASFDKFVPGLWVLLDNAPRLSRSPGAEPAATATGWKFGDELRVTSLRTSPDSTSWVHVETRDATGWLPEALLAPPPLKIPPERLHRIGAESVDRYNGIAHDYAPPDLVRLPDEVGYAKETSYRLRKPAADALMRMVEAARAEGIRLRVVSAYRNHATQRRLYLAKLKKGGWNQTTVARPGHSEHQLGTAVDLSDGDPETLLQEKFGETRAGKWLALKAPEFGFAVSYTARNESLTGYSPEPWHYRYFGPELAPARHRAAIAGEAGR